jgi:hypothetical protein
MAADWAVAAGTGALAIATGWLAWQARGEAAAVRQQVTLLAEQLAASERPAVYPITPHEWLAHLGEGGRWLAFRNGGTGIARNVRGHIWWHTREGSYDDARLIGQTLGPSDHFRVWLGDNKRIGRWWGAEGYVVYQDVRGVEWQSRFRYQHSGSNVYARLGEWAPSSSLDDPNEAFPREGWADEAMPDEPDPERYRT